MKDSFYSKILTLVTTLCVVLTSSGVAAFIQPQQAQAQADTIISYVLSGDRPVWDGCENITGSRYQAIAAELGLDLEGGIKGGFSALGDELKDPALDAGGAILRGLGELGGSLAGSRLGDAIGALGSDIAGLFDGVDFSGVDLGGFGDTLGSIVGGIGSIAGSPIVGNILGGVMGGLFGSGGPEEVQEKGLRKLVDQGQKIALYEQRKITEKERCLDSLARQAGQRALRDMTEQSINWLQDGFTRFDRDGNSGFVENLEQYLIDVDENEYATYLKETESSTGGPLSGTCNFLRRPILKSLTNDYIQNSKPSGLDDIDTNVAPGGGGGCELTSDGMSEAQAEAFLKGDFAAGGWTAFLRSTGDPGSNPIGAYLEQRAEVNNRMADAKERELQQLQWGQGFLANNEGGFTPASIVQGITERLFTSDISRLELIDEMDEIAADLGNTLIGQITERDATGAGLAGLSNLDSSNTVGGQASASSEYLSSRLIRSIENQLAIEREIAGLLPDLVGTETDPGIYNDERIDDLVADAQQCIEEGSLNYTKADLLIGNIVNDQDIFRNTVVLNRRKVDWNGDPLNWIPVIKEETQKPIGWNGKDYDWKNDGVERYYKQGTAEGCEDKDDLLNVSYVIRKEVITDDEFRFNGLFEPLEPGPENTASFLRDDDAGNVDNKNATFIDDKHYTSDMNVYTVWEKQICGDPRKMFEQKTIEGEIKDVASRWQERWYAPVQMLFPESLEGQVRYQNSQCDLSSGYQYCLFPAYRPPQIISGELYKENNQREVTTSQCRTRDDVGTHYFVELDIDDRNGTTTWSTRECVARKSPEGTAAEWEEGFPDSAGTTNIPAYTAATSTNPVQEQLELVQNLDNLLTRLRDGSGDFFAIQQGYYALEDRFNDPDAAANLREEAENFIRDVRELNSLLRESGSCSASYNRDLESFGSGLLPTAAGFGNSFITDFSVADLQQGYQIEWGTEADSCEATSVPPVSSWDGQVGPSGNRLVPQTEIDNLPINLISLGLTCTLNGRKDQRTYNVSTGTIQGGGDNQTGGGGDDEGDDGDDNGGGDGDGGDVDFNYNVNLGEEQFAILDTEIRESNASYFPTGIIDWNGRTRVYYRAGSEVGYIESENLYNWSAPVELDNMPSNQSFIWDDESERVYCYRTEGGEAYMMNQFDPLRGCQNTMTPNGMYNWGLDGTLPPTHIGGDMDFIQMGRVRGYDSQSTGGWGNSRPDYPKEDDFPEIKEAFEGTPYSAEDYIQDRRGLSLHRSDDGYEWSSEILLDPQNVDLSGFRGWKNRDADGIGDFYSAVALDSEKVLVKAFMKEKDRLIDRTDYSEDIGVRRRFRFTGETIILPAVLDGDDITITSNESIIPRDLHERIITTSQVPHATNPGVPEIGQMTPAGRVLHRDGKVFIPYYYRDDIHYEGGWDGQQEGIYMYVMSETDFNNLFN